MLWKWAFDFHGVIPGLKWNEQDENLQGKSVAPSACSHQERWKLSLPRYEQWGLSPKAEAPPRVSNPIPKKVGWITLVEFLPLSIDCKENTSNVFDCLLSFYTPEIWVWWNNSRKMAYCPLRCQGHYADKQRTPPCYRPGFLHLAIFRMKKSNSTNRIYVCGYLVCLDFV